MFSSLVGAKLVIVAVAGSLSIGGVAAAAVAGGIPGPFRGNGSVSAGDDQGASDSASGDPSESADPTDSGDPTVSATPTPSAEPSSSSQPSGSGGAVGPDATGPAAFGLCHAFGGSKALTKADNPSAARRNLLAAATAAGQTIEQYCAVVLGTPLPTTTATADSSTEMPGKHGHGHGNGHGHGHAGSDS